MASRSGQRLSLYRVRSFAGTRCLGLTEKYAGDKLYIGTSTGTVQMHTLGDEQGPSAELPSMNARIEKSTSRWNHQCYVDQDNHDFEETGGTTRISQRC